MVPKSARRGRGVLGLLLLALTVAACWSFLTSANFRLQRVIVEGNHALTAGEVTALAGVAKGDLRWSNSISTLRKRLLADPWIAVANPSWQAGGVLKLQVEERQPLALLQYHGTYLEVDDQGRILEQIGRVPTGRLAVLTGISVDGVLRGDTLPDPMLKGALDALTYMPPDDRQRVSEVHVERSSLTMTLSGPLTVQLGPPTQLDAKIVDLVNLLHSDLKDTVERFNVENPDRTTYIPLHKSLQ